MIKPNSPPAMAIAIRTADEMDEDSSVKKKGY